MKERVEGWLAMFGLGVCISWVGALIAWVCPSLSTISPLEFGLYFSGMSFAGCGLGWLVDGRSDC